VLSVYVMFFMGMSKETVSAWSKSSNIEDHLPPMSPIDSHFLKYSLSRAKTQIFEQYLVLSVVLDLHNRFKLINVRGFGSSQRLEVARPISFEGPNRAGRSLYWRAIH
jgi:hypothetical protein